MATHTFTNNGADITVTWDDTYNLSIINSARDGSQPLTVQVVYDLGDRELVQEVESTIILWYKADIENRWKEYLRFKGDTMPLNPEKKKKGTIPMDVVSFANSSIPMSTVDYFSRNVANQMVNAKLSDGVYKVSPFNQTTLQAQQPVQFTIDVTEDSVTATLTDGTADEWSIDDGITKQSSSTFNGLPDGQYSIIAYSRGVEVNRNIFTISTNI